MFMFIDRVAVPIPRRLARRTLKFRHAYALNWSGSLGHWRSAPRFDGLGGSELGDVE
jgi:hypothetical protein